MANRHLSRSIALQSLYEWDFNGCDDSKVALILKRNLQEFAPGVRESDFVEQLVKGVLDKKAKLDGVIESAARDWPLAQTPIIDRNVLRLGLWELMFGNRDEVPSRVAINEAIELAKTFGGENSGKFVNGVLGTIYKEMGEPGKDEPVRRKGRIPEEKLVGAVVWSREGKEIYLALVHDVFGRWTLSKGHLQEGEAEAAGVVREIQEEIGLEVEVGEHLGSNEYTAYDPQRGKLKKTVSYYLAEAAAKPPIKLKETGGLDDARWFKLAEVGDLRVYPDILAIVAQGIKCLTSQSSKS